MDSGEAYSLMIVGKKTGIELKATLQLKNINWSKCVRTFAQSQIEITLTAAI